MKSLTRLTAVLTITVLFGCSSMESDYEMTERARTFSDTTVVSGNGFISSSAAAVSKDTSRKFIRTADLKFRVKDVRTATLSLENITANFDGFVTYTNLTSNINRTETIPVSVDSSLETIYYIVKNDMVIRVPNARLDSILRTMAVHIDFLDYRRIKAKDVTLSLVSNRLTQKRIEKHTGRLTEAIDSRGKKLKETSTAEESLLSKQERLDKAKLSTLNIQDQIDFSTINLHIYQRQAVKRDLIENYKNIDAFQPGFFSQVWESIIKGWNMLKTMIIGLISNWSLVLFGLIGLFIYKKYFVKNKKQPK